LTGSYFFRQVKQPNLQLLKGIFLKPKSFTQNYLIGSLF
jgi:hypothetical protein